MFVRPTKAYPDGAPLWEGRINHMFPGIWKYGTPTSVIYPRVDVYNMLWKVISSKLTCLVDFPYVRGYSVDMDLRWFDLSISNMMNSLTDTSGSCWVLRCEVQGFRDSCQVLTSQFHVFQRGIPPTSYHEYLLARPLSPQLTLDIFHQSPWPNQRNLNVGTSICSLVKDGNVDVVWFPRDVQHVYSKPEG